MSAGLSHLSDDELMRMLGQAAPEPARAPVAAPAGDLSHLSDADLMRMLGQPAAGGSQPATFDQRFAGTRKSPTARTADTSSSVLGRGLQAQADEMLVGPASAENAASAALRQFGNTAGLNVPRNVAAGIATLTGNGGTFDQNYQLAKDQDAALARQNPKSALAGDVAGIVGGAVTLPGLSGASTPLRRAGQAALTGGVYGFGGELLDSKDLGSASVAGGVGGVLGGTLGLAIEKAAPPLLRLIQGGKPVRDASGRFTADAVNALNSAGLDPATFTPEFAGHIERAFKTKGASPAVAREAQAAEFGIPLSRGQATQDLGALALERQSAAGSRGGRALDVAQDFGQRQTGAIDAARTGLLGRIAGNAPTIDNPAMVGEMIADRARGFAGDAAFRAAAAQRTADTALERVRGPMPPDPLDAASSVMQGVWDAAGRGKAAYRTAYDEVAAIPGEFAPGALDRMGARVQRGLGTEYPVDPVLTPAAHRALADLDNLPGLFGADPGGGPNLQQLDQVRKRLVAYRKAAGLNATDRRVMDKILSEFDGHTQAALEAGLFGPRQAARAADDFPGFTPATGGSDVPFPDLPQAVAGGRERAPESLIQYLARQGGIRMNGDTRAADLHRVMTQTGPLARMNGRSVDDLRVPLMEQGFLPVDPDGGMSRNITDELMGLIRRERAGEPVYRASDAQRAPNLDRGGRAADADAAYAERVGEYAQRAQMELEALGLRSRDLDPAALRDAAESMMLGHVDDAATAYERAVMNRPAGGNVARPAGPEAPPFPSEGATAPAASAALPGGSSEPFQAMQKARGLFADYQRTFKPNGPGDDVGRAVQRMVERDAQPGEVATMLFGGSRAGNTGLSVRMAERMRNVLGEDSPGWQAVQQGLISKAIEGRGGDVGARLDHLLTGEGRTLAVRVLTPEQRAGLDVYRRGLAQVEAERTSLPGWVEDLARSGFDPNAVASGLFGSGVPGSRIGSAEYAKTLKRAFGPDSAEWANLRQAAWLRLVGHGEASRMPAAKEAERVRAFTKGEGSGLARQLFTGDELALMERYADAVRATHVSTGSRLPDGGRSAALAGQVMNLISGAIGFKVGGPGGGMAAYGARVGQRILEGGLNGVRAARSFEGGAPRVRPPLPQLPAGVVPGVAVGAGVGAGILPFGALRMP